ncbi:tellurite resistance TerB family protein [Pseudomonas bohemica]|uniref:tellurite resistance TerB family protein n=1 Tax=Pseudomonas bohemica TaxID=2044872 RepID=UPI000DA604A4|nr:tellurite resistance TerB family protein [Pseudomonas bohemica]
MNTSDLLEQLLRASQGSATQQGGGAAGQGGLGGLLGGLLGAGSNGAGRGGGLGGLLGGLLGGGGLAGSRSGAQTRSGGNNYAMLASLGMMAFQAYQAWQRQQACAPQEAPLTVDQFGLAGPEVDNHSHAILRALIAAAKTDGTIDEQEQQMIQKEIARHADDPELQQWLKAEVAKSLDAAEVAQAANDEPGVAAEMYLASVLMVNDQQRAERDYLDELAAALNIDPQLQVHLEQQAKGTAV